MVGPAGGGAIAPAGARRAEWAVLGWFLLALVAYAAAEPAASGVAAAARITADGVFRALSRDLVSVLLAGAVLLAALGTGWAALAVVLGRGRTGDGRKLWAAAVGLGFLGTWLAGLGFAGLLRWPLLAVAGLFAATHGARILAHPNRRSPVAARLDPAVVTVLVVAAAAVGGQFVGAFAPVVNIDSLHYHLGKAVLYAQTGRIVPMESNFHFLLPSQWEVLLVPAALAGDDAAAQLLSPAVALLTGLLLAAGLRGTAPARGLIAGSLYVSLGIVAGNTAAVKNDLLLALFVLSGFLAVGETRRQGSGGWAVVAGACLGFAFGTKYTAALSAVVVAALVVFPRGGRGLRRAWLVAASGMAVTVPWLAYAWVHSGDPVYPFGGTGLSERGRALIGEESRGYLLGRYGTLLEKLRAPWTLATTDSVSLLPMIAMPFMLFQLAARSAGLFWSLAAAGAGLCWVFGPPQGRHLIPAMPLMAGAAELGLGLWPSAGDARRLITWGLVAAAALEARRGWTDPAIARRERIMTAIGAEDGRAFRRNQLTSYWEAVDWANGNLPPDARVLVYGDRRSCPLARRFLVPSFATPAPFLAFAAESRSEAHLWRKLRQAGVTHILYNRTTAVFGRARLADDLPGLGTVGLWARGWKAHARLVYESRVVDVRQGMFYIYALGGPPGTGASIVLPGIEGWLYIPERLFAEGRVNEAREIMRRLRDVTGDVAMIEAARAAMLPPNEACAALNRAALAGFRSVTVYGQLAACRARAGDFTGARLWRSAATALAWPGSR